MNRASEALRASDTDRELTAAALRLHYGHGRVSLEELSERLGVALAARTQGELDAVLRDLPTRQRTSRGSLGHHSRSYLAVNVLLVGIWLISGAGYFWPIWILIGWGAGLATHALAGEPQDLPSGCANTRAVINPSYGRRRSATLLPRQQPKPPTHYQPQHPTPTTPQANPHA